MGALTAELTLLADWITSVQSFVDVFVLVYVLLIFFYVLTSWIKLPLSLSPLQRFLNDVCEPYLRLFRRLLPSLGPLDLSPMVGVIALLVVRQIFDSILNRLH